MVLTRKQQQFVLEYLVDLNATQAAIRAGYSKTTARQIGQENLTKPVIQKVLKKAIDQRKERTKVTQDMVIGGLLKEAQEATTDSARIAAWAWLGKHLGMFASENAGNAVAIQILSHIPGPTEDFKTT